MGDRFFGKKKKTKRNKQQQQNQTESLRARDASGCYESRYFVWLHRAPLIFITGAQTSASPIKLLYGRGGTAWLSPLRRFWVSSFHFSMFTSSLCRNLGRFSITKDRLCSIAVIILPCDYADGQRGQRGRSSPGKCRPQRGYTCPAQHTGPACL